MVRFDYNVSLNNHFRFQDMVNIATIPGCKYFSYLLSVNLSPQIFVYDLQYHRFYSLCFCIKIGRILWRKISGASDCISSMLGVGLHPIKLLLLHLRQDIVKLLVRLPTQPIFSHTHFLYLHLALLKKLI